MPVVTVYRHGFTAGIPNMSNHPRAKRQEVKGWSPGAVRRNVQFLRSVDERQLTGEGWALTLTVRDCPPSHEDWHRAIANYLQQVRYYLKPIRMHWVTEWQKRGVPHLHGVMWFPDEITIGNPPHSWPYNVKNMLEQLWLPYGAPFGAGPRGQLAKRLNGPVGWFQYISKHAARGVRHYQRSAENIPQGWKKTGRMWGKAGDWPLRDPVRFETDNPAYHILRRWCRSWRIADARFAYADMLRSITEGRQVPASLLRSTKLRIPSARHMLRCPNPTLSRVHGISEWISEALLLRMIEYLNTSGYPVDAA